MLLRKLLSIYMLMLIVSSCLASESSTITFKSGDGLLITADTYITHPVSTTPLIVLFHQAGWSRGEYNETALEFNRLGINCIAVDLRSGDQVRGKQNQTALRARKKGLGTNYADALPDIIAALQYVNQQYSNNMVLALGSSYSAALVLKVAGDYPELIDGVLAFSPGEYFSHLGKSKTWIQDSSRNIKVPVFITSSKNEAGDWSSIYDVINEKHRQKFIPVTDGNHGSRALWKKYDDSKAYWEAVTLFLSKISID